MSGLDFSFFGWAFIRDYLLSGLWFSLTLTAVATVAGVALGTVLAVMRLSGRRWLAWPAAAYVNLMRAVPLVMVILWFFLLVPLLIGRPIDAAGSAFLTFSLFEAAYFSEILRAGIQSVPRGQWQAAQALGLRQAQVFGLVVMPQALRTMLPVLLTQTIVLFQDTSLVYAIGAYDLLKGFEVAGRNLNRPVEGYLLAGLCYFVLCLGLSLAVRRLQARAPLLR